jgi:hypothetical protein
MSELETLLRSWRPRRPSPRIKTLLFAPKAASMVGGAGAAAVEHPVQAFRLGWLAPATITLMLGCVLLNQHNAFVLSQSSTYSPLVAAALSNQSAAAWLPGSFEAAHNSLPVERWTNDNGFGPAMNSSGSSRTN